MTYVTVIALRDGVIDGGRRHAGDRWTMALVSAAPLKARGLVLIESDKLTEARAMLGAPHDRMQRVTKIRKLH